MHMVKSAKRLREKGNSPSHSRPHPTRQKEQFPVYSCRNMSSTGRHTQTHPQMLCVVEIGTGSHAAEHLDTDFSMYLGSAQMGIHMGGLRSIH